MPKGIKNLEDCSPFGKPATGAKSGESAGAVSVGAAVQRQYEYEQGTKMATDVHPAPKPIPAPTNPDTTDEKHRPFKVG